MLFSCTKCKAKYKVPDERVRGKSLKISCKTCGSVIVVRDPALIQQKGADEPVWFAGLNGKQVGPMSAGALRKLVVAGRVASDDLVWRPGMSDWTPAGQVAEIGGSDGSSEASAVRSTKTTAPRFANPLALAAQSAASAAASPQKRPGAGPRNVRPRVPRDVGQQAAPPLAPPPDVPEPAAPPDDLPAPETSSAESGSTPAERGPGNTIPFKMRSQHPVPVSEEVAEPASPSLASDDGLEDEFADFFKGVPSDVHAELPSFDGEPISMAPRKRKVTKEEKKELKKALKEGSAAASPFDHFDRQAAAADHQAMREEFSVIIRLDREKRRRGLVAVIALVGVLAAAAVTVVIVSAQQEGTARVARATGEDGDNKEYEASFDPRYEIIRKTMEDDPDKAAELARQMGLQMPPAQPPTEEQPPADPTTAPKEADKKHAAAPPRKTPAKKKAVENGDTKPKKKTKPALTEEQYAALTRAIDGKAETRVGGGTETPMKKASAEAEEAARKRQEEEARKRALAIKTAFKRKKQQFKRCRVGEQENVKVQFEVDRAGRVTSSTVSGTQSTRKATCVKELLGRAQFPRGEGSDAYKYSLIL